MNRQHLGDQYEAIWRKRNSSISFKARAGTIGYNDTTANNVVQTQITFLNLTPKAKCSRTLSRLSRRLCNNPSSLSAFCIQHRSSVTVNRSSCEETWLCFWNETWQNYLKTSSEDIWSFLGSSLGFGIEAISLGLIVGGRVEVWNIPTNTRCKRPLTCSQKRL